MLRQKLSEIPSVVKYLRFFLYPLLILNLYITFLFKFHAWSMPFHNLTFYLFELFVGSLSYWKGHFWFDCSCQTDSLTLSSSTLWYAWFKIESVTDIYPVPRAAEVTPNYNISNDMLHSVLAVFLLISFGLRHTCWQLILYSSDPSWCGPNRFGELWAYFICFLLGSKMPFPYTPLVQPTSCKLPMSQFCDCLFCRF